MQIDENGPAFATLRRIEEQGEATRKLVEAQGQAISGLRDELRPVVMTHNQILSDQARTNQVLAALPAPPQPVMGSTTGAAAVIMQMPRSAKFKLAMVAFVLMLCASCVSAAIVITEAH